LAIELTDKSYILEAQSLASMAGFVFAQSSVLVRMREQPMDRHTILRKAFGLTKAEARVAVALASGLDVKCMAEHFDCQANTIRDQLKSAYAKTGTGSQAQLVALISQYSS
jgi:DNA-binding CsgD family transcriptional regulator